MRYVCGLGKILGNLSTFGYFHVRHVVKEKNPTRKTVMVGQPKPQLNVPSFLHYSDILRMDSTNADALYVRGLCLYYEDCIEKAVQFFVQALRMAPDHEKACVACRVSSRHQSYVVKKECFLRLNLEWKVLESQECLLECLVLSLERFQGSI